MGKAQKFTTAEWTCLPGPPFCSTILHCFLSGGFDLALVDIIRSHCYIFTVEFFNIMADSFHLQWRFFFVPQSLSTEEHVEASGLSIPLTSRTILHCLNWRSSSRPRGSYKFTLLQILVTYQDHTSKCYGGLCLQTKETSLSCAVAFRAFKPEKWFS